MPLFNKFILNVDLKRQLTAKARSGGQITIAQGESALLIFKVFDDGLPYDYTSATKSKLFIKTAGGHHIETDVEIIDFENGKALSYKYEKVASVEEGFSQLVLAIYENDYVVNIQPFNVYIYDNLKGSGSTYLELIKDLMDIIEDLNINLDNTIKLSEKGMPNGVATLDKDGKIPFIQMPKEIENFLLHINHTVFKDQVHGILISEDGILQYKTPIGVQNAGFAPDAIGSGIGSQVLNATVTVKDGVATVLYTGVPTVVSQKFAEGERNLAYFVLSGTTFNGFSFNVSKLGLHTLWYTDSNGNTYTTLFNVNSTQLALPSITVEVEQGIVDFVIDKATSIVKWDKGVRDVPYFAYNGTVVTGNTFKVTEVGKYTIYYKLTNGVEYVEVFEVTSAMLPKPDTTPPTLTYTTTNVANGVEIRVVATDSESGIDYMLSPINGKVTANVLTYTVVTNGDYTFKAYDKSGNVGTLTVVINSIVFKSPTISLSANPTYATNGVVDITVGTKSNNTDGTIVSTKWYYGNRSIDEFANGGTVLNSQLIAITANAFITVYTKDSFGAEAVKTIQVNNIDKIAPYISLSQYPTAITNGSVTITASVGDTDSGLVLAKYDSGNRTASYFETSGSILPSSNLITATDNGIYTVYAKDAAGNTSTKTISINNISKSVPTITLSQSPTTWTNGDVTITANVNSSLALSDVKWASGNQTASYFTSSGSSFSTSFKVSNNNTYTVYAKDIAGNSVVQTIVVNRIDKTAPTITLPSTNTTGNITVNIVDSESGVSVRKWASGNQSNSYFASNGTTFTGTTISVSNSGTYSVYAKDNAGNETIKTVNVNIPVPAPTFTIEASPTTYGQSIVTVAVPSGTTIRKFKYAPGSYDVNYFANGGTTSDEPFFVTSVGGMYTVYIEDNNGGKAVAKKDISIISNTTGYTAYLTSSYGNDNKQFSITDTKNKNNISELQLYWSTDNSPVPLSHFRAGRGIYLSAITEPDYTNYSNYFSYRTLDSYINGQRAIDVGIKYKNVNQGYFTGYIKLKSGEEFIAYSKAID